MFSVFTDEFYMREALKEAQKAADIGEVPVGAVIVCKNKIIARAHNLTETMNDVTAHAEILAITAAAQGIGFKYLPDCTLFVTLEPCVMCAGASAWAQMGRLVYGADDDKKGYLRYAPDCLHPKTKVSNGLFAEDAGNMLVNFFKEKR